MRVSGTNPAGVSMRFLSSKKRFKPKNLFSSRCHEIQAGITDNPIPTIIYTVAAIVSGISSSEKILGEYCSKTKGEAHISRSCIFQRTVTTATEIGCLRFRYRIPADTLQEDHPTPVLKSKNQLCASSGQQTRRRHALRKRKPGKPLQIQAARRRI